jgi:hypothetical protein
MQFRASIARNRRRPSPKAVAQLGSAETAELPLLVVEPAGAMPRFRLAKRRSRRSIGPMGNLIAKIKKWLGLDKK